MQIKNILTFGILVLLNFSVPAQAQNAQPTQRQMKADEAGATRAEVSYEEQDFYINNVRLFILRDGKPILEQPIVVKQIDPKTNAVEEITQFLGVSEPKVIDLDQDNYREIALSLSTRGAHCCSYTLIYTYNPANDSYNRLQVDWGNFPSAGKLEDIDENGTQEFIARDDRFSGEFAGYAGSFRPIQIWQYRNGKMLDVTRNYPKIVYNDAYQFWQFYNTELRRQPNPNLPQIQSVFAAYLANKYLLNQQADGWKRIRELYNFSDRQQYFTRLEKFLKDAGYSP
ncbi:hypothetical protein NG798_16555 [Ancylothrix sp. C2]|uniref:hypothetical protein n=1 Tax=Ancylothrix sp. D3o TaxID=2953691 RepID=UPI0021BB8DB6|nr:hypothetical protein [Ancylothrix sp. D3o]MCT7951414.1 hypothetical protein [Ancylothrix sp. D3o]